MIQVAKSTTIPAILIDRGISAKDENCHLYNSNPTDYDDGLSKFTIQSSIYGDKSVKQQLITEQHEK